MVVLILSHRPKNTTLPINHNQMLISHLLSKKGLMGLLYFGYSDCCGETGEGGVDSNGGDDSNTKRHEGDDPWNSNDHPNIPE